MASDADTADQMNDWLRARGYICGRSYASVNDLASGIKASAKDMNESPDEFERRVKRIVKSGLHGFKSRGENEVSASEPKCG